jgi:hypothetical protein
LNNLLPNSPDTLRKQLDEGLSFYKGDLTTKLKNINLPRLEEGSRRSIGISVARLANTGTFNVLEEGIDACLNRLTAIPWTTHYMHGLILGLVSTSEGQIYVTKELIRKVRKILSLINNLQESINFLIENLSGMAPVSRFQDTNFKNEVVSELRELINDHTESKEVWIFLITVLDNVN